MNEDLDVDIHFGKVNQQLLNWREIDIANEDADNDEDFPVEADVKSVLGFDPDAE